MAIMAPEAVEAIGGGALEGGEAGGATGAIKRPRKKRPSRAAQSSTTGGTVRRNRSGYKRVTATRGETAGGYEGFTMRRATPVKQSPDGSYKVTDISQPNRGRRSTGKKRQSSLSLPRSDKRRSSPLRKVANKTPVLVGEYIACVLIIGSELITQTARNGYQKTIASVMLRLTALTGVFFVLFMFATGGGRSSEFAAWFGLLIVIATILDASNKGTIMDMGDLLTGTALTDQGTVLTDEISGTTESHGGIGGK